MSSIQDLERSLCKTWEDVKESLPSDCNSLALETNDKPKRKKKQLVLQKRTSQPGKR